MGTPLIASNSMGLREMIADTPVKVCASEDINSLTEQMRSCISNNNVDIFQRFIPEARQRYNVAKTAQELLKFIDTLY